MIHVLYLVCMEQVGPASDTYRRTRMFNIAATAPLGLGEPWLRRAQALATVNGIEIAIARDLLTQKLHGQAEVLERIPESENDRASVERTLLGIGQAGTVEQL